MTPTLFPTLVSVLTSKFHVDCCYLERVLLTAFLIIAEKIRVEHINLEWSIDFTRQVISGTAVYDLVAASENEPEVVIDPFYKVVS